MPDEPQPAPQQIDKILNMLSTSAQAVQSLAQAQEAMKELLTGVYREQQTVRASTSGFELEIGLMKMRLDNMEKSMHKIQHVLTDDNGDKSLITRIKDLEFKSDHQADMEKVHAQGKYALWTAIGVSLISLASALAIAFVK